MSDPKPYFLRGERRWDSNVKIPGKRAEVGRHDRVSDASKTGGRGEQQHANTSNTASKAPHHLQVLFLTFLPWSSIAMLKGVSERAEFLDGGNIDHAKEKSSK